MKIYPLLALTLCCLYSNANADLTSFGTDGIKAWKKQIFSGETSYELMLLEGKPVLKALSNGSASGLVLKKRIDLLKTPYMSWSWRVSKTLPGLDERTKDGDDYAARIYVVIEKGFMGLKTKALNYVWSGSQAQGKIWNNAYAGSSVKMVSVRGKDSSTEKWYYEKRNVYEDMIKYFGDKGNKADNIEAYRYIDAIAVMTDTDNSGLVAESYYDDISFSSE
ncbi:MAG: DUF3047 domain-containing protein [Candidatus Electrothrix sp. GW3-4]|uniref:DUF3047 domain-containing protein n=1 Tax=Candidatus Electrothrix sp. GW3-4 TaxID=3126740 RepID=UPI0030D113F2